MSDTPADSTHRAAEVPSSEFVRGSFGAWLRHQREARSISLREIADSSKISLRYLDALEQDRFDILPAPVFARGFLREYARIVGLNPDEVVNLYLVAIDERKLAGGGRSEPGLSAMARQKSGPSSLGYGLLLALAVLIFLAVAAGLSFFVERRRSSSPSTTPGASRERVLPQRASEPASVPDAPGFAPPAVSDAPARPPAAVPASGPAQPSALVPQRIQVVLSFAQDCWVELSVDGGRRMGEQRGAGETVTIEAAEVVLLTLGNVASVSAEVNGRPFALPSSSSSRVLRDLRIDRAAAGLEAAVEAPAAASVPEPSPATP